MINFTKAIVDNHSKSRRISLVIPCYNEEDNINALYERLSDVTDKIKTYSFSFYFIDNASTDNTLDLIRELSQADIRVKGIANARNFGHIRSPWHGFLEADGDCVILMASDLQDPPELIPEFIRHWESGSSVVVGSKKTSDELSIFFLLRSIYYGVLKKISNVPLLEHITGFGLYDRRIVEICREMGDPYPYIRGIVSEIGLPLTTVPYHQPLRKRGITKNNFFTLLDMAMLGLTSYSISPLRFATIGGFFSAMLSLAIAIIFLVLKLIYWENIPAGYAPAVIGIFFIGSIQIFLLGIVGEYVGATLTQVKKRPLVVEKERIGKW